MKKSQPILSAAKFAERCYRLALFLFLFVCILVCIPEILSAQNCSSSTPTYTIDMTGNPDSIWTSPSVGRAGQCCNVKSPDVCILFKITLDTNAVGVRVEISGGTGTTDYQNNCGNTTPVGSVMCLTGKGPHNLTVCKPGGNNQVYKIYSIPRAYAPIKTTYISQTCSTKVIVVGMKESTINWSSLSGTQYNSNLSCTSGCDTAIVKPNSTFPQYVDYQVCGTPDNACNTTKVCDTVRVYFVTQLGVSISPKNGYLCDGNPSLQLTATATGGKPPYQYEWNTTSKTTSITATPGKYYVKVKDLLNCYIATDTVVVTKVTNPDPVVSGDSILCEKTKNKTYSVVNDTGSTFSWSVTGGTIASGAGTNAVTVDWGSSGSGIVSVTQKYKTTGCTGTKNLNIKLNPLPDPVITGDTVICELTKNVAYSVTKNTGNSYSWSISGGKITSGANSNVILVTWGSYGTGSLTVTETVTATACKKSVNKVITLNSRPPKKSILR